jgi:hypothetical protein
MGHTEAERYLRRLRRWQIYTLLGCFLPLCAYYFTRHELLRSVAELKEQFDLCGARVDANQRLWARLLNEEPSEGLMRDFKQLERLTFQGVALARDQNYVRRQLFAGVARYYLFSFWQIPLFDLATAGIIIIAILRRRQRRYKMSDRLASALSAASSSAAAAFVPDVDPAHILRESKFGDVIAESSGQMQDDSPLEMLRRRYRRHLRINQTVIGVSVCGLFAASIVLDLVQHYLLHMRLFWFVLNGSLALTAVGGFSHWISRTRFRRAGSRALRDQCIQCGYDLRGSTDRCPECGTVFEHLPHHDSGQNPI